MTGAVIVWCGRAIGGAEYQFRTIVQSFVFLVWRVYIFHLLHFHSYKKLYFSSVFLFFVFLLILTLNSHYFSDMLQLSPPFLLSLLLPPLLPLFLLPLELVLWNGGENPALPLPGALSYAALLSTVTVCTLYTLFWSFKASFKQRNVQGVSHGFQFKMWSKLCLFITSSLVKIKKSVWMRPH